MIEEEVSGEAFPHEPALHIGEGDEHGIYLPFAYQPLQGFEVQASSHRGGHGVHLPSVHVGMQPKAREAPARGKRLLNWRAQWTGRLLGSRCAGLVDDALALHLSLDLLECRLVALDEVAF